MFLLNSCLGQFSAAHLREHPFSRSYGVILPSSLTILLPPALGFSPHPPVSVYGTGHNETIAAFLDGLLNSFPTLFRSASHLRLMRGFFLPHIYCACTGFLIPGSVLPSVSLQFCSLRVQESQPAVHRLRISASPEAPTYPGQISFTLETLDIRPKGFSPFSRYSFRHSLFLKLHSSFRYCFVASAMLLYQSFRIPELRCRV